MLACCSLLPAAPADDQPKEKGMLDRIMQLYSWNDPKAPKSAYQGKKFDTKGGYGDKKFSTGNYDGVKKFGTKEFETKNYGDSGKSWLGKIFHTKKLPEKLQGDSRELSKRFETGTFATKAYDKGSKADPYKGRELYATKEANLKGKTQGALDSDRKLQETIRKGLSIDDVKRLLNKPVSSTE